MRNKRDKTPVIPVFIAEKQGNFFLDVKFERKFPQLPHKRSEHGQKLVDKLKYSPYPLHFLLHLHLFRKKLDGADTAFLSDIQSTMTEAS
jgi:hypothetical protein